MILDAVQLTIFCAGAIFGSAITCVIIAFARSFNSSGKISYSLEKNPNKNCSTARRKNQTDFSLPTTIAPLVTEKPTSPK